jgi:hypothetical protein
MKPSKAEIVDYWTEHVNEAEIGVDWVEAEERCWRCGYEASLQKCHIVPDSLGGSSEPSNFVLLCHRCHREAPDHTNPEYMWTWIKSTSVSLYDAYWTFRAMEMFEKMFGREPFSNIDQYDLGYKEITSLVKKEIRKGSTHFGEGSINPSTIACVIKEVEERLEA